MSVIATQLLLQLFRSVDYLPAALHLGLRREAAATLAGSLKSGRVRRSSPYAWHTSNGDSDRKSITRRSRLFQRDGFLAIAPLSSARVVVQPNVLLDQEARSGEWRPLEVSQSAPLGGGNVHAPDTLSVTTAGPHASVPAAAM